MPSPNLLVDDVLARYESPRRIGGGGQKEVFLVSDPVRGPIVIKIGGFRSPESLERVRREVQTLSSINSPYYPRQYGFDIVDGARYVITEEYLDGPPLSDQLTSFADELILMPLARSLVIALGELWKRRIVHRDVKPANILITSDGPKIIDLGIARLLDATSLTLSIAPFGPCTPQYASPEQLRNSKRDIDHRSDQFSLGIVLAQLAFSGIHPFDPHVVGGENIPRNIVEARWAKAQISDCTSPGLFILLNKVLSPEPYMRYRTTDDVLLVVKGILEGRPQ